MGLHQSSGSALCACDIPVTRGLCHLKRVWEINESACVDRGGGERRNPPGAWQRARERERDGSESHRCLVGGGVSPSGVGKVSVQAD